MRGGKMSDSGRTGHGYGWVARMVNVKLANIASSLHIHVGVAFAMRPSVSSAQPSTLSQGCIQASGRGQRLYKKSFSTIKTKDSGQFVF